MCWKTNGVENWKLFDFKPREYSLHFILNALKDALFTQQCTIVWKRNEKKTMVWHEKCYLKSAANAESDLIELKISRTIFLVFSSSSKIPANISFHSWKWPLSFTTFETYFTNNFRKRMWKHFYHYYYGFFFFGFVHTTSIKLIKSISMLRTIHFHICQENTHK